MTAEDVVWNALRFASVEVLAGTTVIAPGWKNIFDRAEALDKYKFRIHLKQDYAFVFNLIPPIGNGDAYAFPRHGWVDNGSTEQGFEKAGAPGTGPFKFVERKIGQFIRHRRFDDYYSVPFRANHKEMEVVLAAEDAPRIAMVKTGQADIANSSGPFADEIVAAGLTVDGPKTVDIVYLGLYQTYDPGHCTSKLEVRKAMNLAVDAEAIMKALWPEGAAVRAITSFTSPYDEAWDPSLKPYPYDPEEARRLLKAAGCEGFEFVGNGYAWNVGPEMADMVDAIVTYLKAVGIKAKYAPIDWTAVVPKIQAEQLGSKDGPATGGAHWQLAARNFADKIRVHGLCKSRGGSVCTISDQDKWKKNYLEYAAILDPAKRKAYAQQLGRELYDQYVGVPIAYRDAIWALNPKTICGDWQPIDGQPTRLLFNTLKPC
jgi:peptide/nickel transport system substrate-binding protein